MNGTTSHRVYRRVIRRETHSPRSAAAIVIAALVVVAFAWAATEAVLLLLDRPSLLVAPSDALRALVRLDRIDGPLLVAAGVPLVLIGAVLVVVAVTPGRRARHHRMTARSAIVVDDRVIASALAGAAAYGPYYGGYGGCVQNQPIYDGWGRFIGYQQVPVC